ncbi:hypothetical protein IC235_02490 [Hymenobacter sp. BT664]|uniref:Uncharacterized protein n=1 Tax=Hymenobacter montanus TaxID=2771359 RepID=A0A927BAX4_9BACT|nr:hypothetical protein [Hymenobacter montanus]MBD2766757.1 hypothetical protein [Hymenobacter montanus]
MFNRLKKFLGWAAVALILIVIGYFVTVNGLSYEVSGYRPYNEQLDKAHLREMSNRFDDAYAANEQDLRRFALRNTALELDFAMRKNAMKNPNSILDSKIGHCMMYSYVMASTYNQLAKLKKIKGSCRVAYGHVFLYNVNLHQFFSSTFFRDHDFCVISDDSGVYVADAILFDYLLIDDIRLRK